MKKNNKKLKLFSLIFLILFCLYVQTVAYSAINSTMTIKGDAYARVDADVRVTDFSINDASDGALSAYEEFGKNNLETSVTMPYSDSYVVFKVDITNYGNANMGIKDIDGLHSNLSYDLIDYNLKDKLCDENGSCNLGSVSTFLIKIKYNNYDSSNTIYSINLNINFEQVFDVTYSGISNNNYPNSVMLNDDLNITFTENIPKVIPYSDGLKLSNYSYLNNNLFIDDVKGNINVVYKDKVYMTLLEEGQFFKSDEYISNIKKVYFVDYIDENDHLIEWDLSESEDGTIVGWIDNSSDYNLYIGSDWNIYSKNLTKAFYNMSSITNIYFDNFNTSECTSKHYMFYGLSSLVELDLSNFDTKNVKNMARMFQNVSKITKLDLGNFDTSNATGMYSMFNGCTSIVELDLSNFNVEKVTGLDSMFYNMTSLKELNLNSFNTIKVENFEYAFYKCSQLSSLDLSSFNTSSASNMSRMFGHCYNLKKIYVGDGWDTTNVTSSESMFSSSSLLPNYDANYIDVTKAYVGDGGYLSYPPKTFNIDGVSYKYEDGMTWRDWVDSIYDTRGFVNNNDLIYTDDLMYALVYEEDNGSYTSYSWPYIDDLIDPNLVYVTFYEAGEDGEW